jgi:hypothetical protein
VLHRELDRRPAGESGLTGGAVAESATPSSPVKLGLYGRGALAKDACVPPDGSGSHRLAIGGDVGSFTWTRTGSNGRPSRHNAARRRSSLPVR